MQSCTHTHTHTNALAHTDRKSTATHKQTNSCVPIHAKTLDAVMYTHTHTRTHTRAHTHEFTLQGQTGAFSFTENTSYCVFSGLDPLLGTGWG